MLPLVFPPTALWVFFSSLTPATSSLRVHHIVNMVILMKIR
jgi:hypothetical protein